MLSQAEPTPDILSGRTERRPRVRVWLLARTRRRIFSIRFSTLFCARPTGASVFSRDLQ